MITEQRVQEALDFLIRTDEQIGKFVEQARLKESLVKHVKALEMKLHNEKPLGAQEREACASKRFHEAITEDAIAAGELRGIIARRQTAEATISLYQTQIKARIGPRP